MSTDLARICPLCQHEDRNELDDAMMSGTRAREVADQYGFTMQEVLEHKIHAIYPYVEDASIEQMDALIGEAAASGARCKTYNQERELLKAIELAANMVVKKVDMVKKRSANMSANGLDVQQVRDKLVDALEAHPDAVAAVVKALGGGRE